jgi:hypothetical protein
LFFSLEHLVHVAVLLVHPAEGKHPMPLSRSNNYRMKAIACEQQAGDASDPTSKQGWEELAIEWHTMASLAPSAKNAGRLPQSGACRTTAQMDHKGVEFTVTPVEPGLWKWQFQIGKTVTTGKTKSNLMGMAARRVQQRIDRELNRSRK